jgi:NitT/TauT family transport system substrate-binding protein
MKIKFSLILAAIVAATIGVLLWSSCHKPDDEILSGTSRIRLQLQWSPQAQFVGFYVASEKNYYGDENLQVEILTGGYNIPPIGRVISGEADIGTATGDQVLISRANRNNIKAIGVVFPQSIACFMTKKEQNITTPKDLIRALLKRHHIDETQLSITPVSTITAFTKGEVDAFPSYVINEPLIMNRQGIAINTIAPEDFGVQFYSDTIFTTAAYWGANRDTLKRFLKATAKGWDFARQNPDEAIDILFRAASSLSQDSESRTHQTQMLQETLKRMRAGSGPEIFRMDLSRWDSMEASLQTIGKVSSKGYAKNLCDFSLTEEAP